MKNDVNYANGKIYLLKIFFCEQSEKKKKKKKHQPWKKGLRYTFSEGLLVLQILVLQIQLPDVTQFLYFFIPIWIRQCCY